VTQRETLTFAAVFALAAVAVVLRIVGVAGQAVFIISALSLMALAWLLGEATDQAGDTAGPRVSALLNATMGNLPEMVIVVLAINAGLADIARASIIGSVIGNVLLILGLSLVLGGLKHGAQTFNARLAATNSSMLVLGVAGLGVPTLFAAVNHSSHDAEVLSWWTAAALLVSYVAYVYYSFTTPGLRYRHPEMGATWTRTQAVGLLCVTALATGVVSEVLVKSIEPTVRSLGVPRTFIGLIVVPFVGNAAEHFSAVRLAYRNSLDFAMGIAYGSGIQIALAASALAVFVSIPLGPNLTLVFPPLELAALAAAALVSTLVARGGETNWLEGLQLLVIYFVVAVAFWLLG
jgi:Ca2+:H+ antiporter